MLHPSRPVRLLEPDLILWAPSLRGMELRRSAPIHAVLAGLLPRLEAGGRPEGPAEEAVAAMLRERGHLVESAPDPDAAWGGERQGAVLRAEVFQPADWLRWADLRRADGVPLLAVGFAGDGEQGWAYSFRPGLDPCLRCFLGRWLAGRGDSEALRLALERELAFQWEPAAATARLEEALERSLGSPGRAMLVDGEIRPTNFLPVPACAECAPDQPARGGSLVGPLGLVKRLRHRSPAQGVHLVTASLGFPRWATGGDGFQAGAGCAGSRSEARQAALGEALERYAAAVLPADLEWSPPRPEEPLLPHFFTDAQHRTPGFPYREPAPGERLPWLPVRLLGPRPAAAARAPADQVLLLRRGLSPEPDPLPALSHGLACGPTLRAALTAALLELLERDATARFWGALLAGRQDAARVLSRRPGRLLLEVPCAGGVSVAIAFLESRGRLASGAAARFSRRAAARKALWEARHNLAVLKRDPGPAPTSEPEDFQEHVRYYWHLPERFPRALLAALPARGLGRGESAGCLPDGPAKGPRLGFPGSESARPDHPSRLEDLVARLDAEGWRAWCRDLTTPDVRTLGRRVVRVLVPGLLHLPSHHGAWPRGLPRWQAAVGPPDLTAPRLPHPFG